MNRVKKFVELINKRETILKEHLNGKTWEEQRDTNFPAESIWYCQNIMPIDREIVNTANAIIAKFSIPCQKQTTITEVLSNKWLTRLLKKEQQPQVEK